MHSATRTRRSDLPARRPSRRMSILLLGLVSMLLMAPLTAVYGLTFTYSYDERERPDFDPNGTRLRAITDAAIDIWSDYILDGGNLEFDLSWQDLDDGDLGVYESGIGPINANIILDTMDDFGNPRKWFFDPTPFDNEEFTMERQQYGTLFASDQSNWYNGNPPDQLEAAYYSTNSTIPDNHYDLLSVVLHELGHFAGIVGAVDGAYDFNSNYLGGRSAAVEAAVADTNHLAPVNALMYPVLSRKTRRMPSATDILATQDHRGYTDFDLPRVDFLGENGNSWNTRMNWVGRRVPNFDNEVFIQHGGIAEIPAGTPDQTVANLIVESSILRIVDSNLAVANDLRIRDGGALEASGTVVVLGTTYNTGTIRALPGGTLTLSDNGTSARWDLDGFGPTQGNLDALEGDLVVSGGTYNDTFSGQLLIGPGRRATFGTGFGVSQGGEVVLIGTSAVATLAGTDSLLLRGDVIASGTGAISAPFQTSSTSSFNINSPSDELRLTGALKRFIGGSFSGNGTLRAETNIEVFDDTTIDVNTFDWDGSVVGQTFNVISGTLTINSQQIDTNPAVDGFDDSLFIGGQGTLAVNTPQPWRLDGSLRIKTGGTLMGTEMVITGGAVLNTLGVFPNPAAFVDAPIRVETGGQIDAPAQLDLRNTTILAGGSITGTRVDQFGDLVVESDSVIAPGLYNWSAVGGQTTVVHTAARLEVTPNSLSQFFPGNRYNGHVTVHQGGQLHVDLGNSDSWTVANRMTLLGGQVSGDRVTAAGVVEGEGSLTNSLTNVGTVAPGVPVGQLNVTGTYDQRATGTLEIQLAGTTPAAEYDRLSIFGSALLDGTVAVELVDGFLPAPGSSYEFLSAFFPIDGTFSELEILAPSDVIIEGQLQYSISTVSFIVSDAYRLGDFDRDGALGCADVDSLVSVIATGGADNGFDLNGDNLVDQADLQTWLDLAGALNLASPYLPGDANLDGDVNAMDYAIWQDHKFTATAAWCAGDFTADGHIDGADLLVWNAYKLQSSDNLSAPVPEPSVWILVLNGTLFFGRGGKQRRLV